MTKPVFGNWDPMTCDAICIATPVGIPCTVCMELICEGDVGLMQPDPVHRECLMLVTVGHFNGVCSCTNYAGKATFREAALELERRVLQRDS